MITRKTLSSRAVTGMYYQQLEGLELASWAIAASMYMPSNQPTETYPWLGMVPGMREWIGGRQATALRAAGVEISNKKFESTIQMDLDELEEDKTGQVAIRIGDLAGRGVQHWASLLSTLNVAGESTPCYDGQNFYDTDHAEGASGVQSNRITLSLATLPLAAGLAGTATAPSPQAMKHAIFAGIQAMYGFLDDKGEPMNEGAMAFHTVVPTSYMSAALSAVTSQTFAGGEDNDLARNQNLDLRSSVDARLPWTDRFTVFRADGFTRAMIRQESKTPVLKAKAEGSEFEMDYDAHQYGIDSRRNVGYGFWQNAVMVQLTA